MSVRAVPRSLRLMLASARSRISSSFLMIGIELFGLGYRVNPRLDSNPSS